MIVMFGLAACISLPVALVVAGLVVFHRLHRAAVVARAERDRLYRELEAAEHEKVAHEDADREQQIGLAVCSNIMSVSTDAIIAIDEDLAITSYNEGARKLFGHAAVDVIGAPIDILAPAASRAQLHDELAKLAAQCDGAHKLNHVGLCKDGREFPAAMIVSKLEVIGKITITVTVCDMTKQQRAEHRQAFLADIGLVLATSLDYENTLHQIAKLAVRDVADMCMVDAILGQEAVHRIEAVCRDADRSWVCERFMAIELDRSRSTLTSKVLVSGQSVWLADVSSGDLVAVAQNDEHLQLLQAANIRSMITVALTAHGNIVGAMCLISSKHRYDEEDLRLAEEMGQRAALAIDNARLYGVAQRAIRARDDVLSLVAHDLRSPLNAIALNADLLMQDMLKPRKGGESIHRSATRMNRLIQDLLDVTRLDGGRLTVNRTTVTTRELLAAIVESQRALVHSSGLVLELMDTPNLPDVLADRDRLVQIFENLIGNALKFTEHGSIIVGATPHDREVVFWVRDTGIGIPDEQLPHVFDRFWHDHKDTRRGAGLGLAIAKGLVDAHGGHIWCESKQGFGSTFYFTMAAVPAIDVATPAGPAEALTTHPRSS